MSKQSRRKVEEPAAIDVTEAVRRAVAFLTQVFADAQIRDVRLEEVEFVDDDGCWLVTLSFLRPIPKEEIPSWERLTQNVAGADYRREYKAVEVDARRGEPRSIKMRSPV